MLSELLSSATPPGAFFVPWVFALFVGFYGTAALLIREIAFRWRVGWLSILLLGAAYGVLNEGMAARSFFDPNWRSLGPLAHYGWWGSVNWIWALLSTEYHAMFSVAAPIVLTEAAFADDRNRKWLGNGALTVVALVFVVVAAIFVVHGNPAQPPGPGEMRCLVGVVVLLLLAARFIPAAPARSGGLEFSSLLSYFVIGLVGASYLVASIYWMPALGLPPAALLLWSAATPATAVLFFLRVGRRGWWTGPRRCALACGGVAFFALLAPFQEINPSRTDPASGMGLVGLAAGLYLIWVWKRTRKETDKEFAETAEQP